MLLASSSASGAGGGGPPRQGSPFTHPFISPPQQVGGGGIVEISTGGMLTHYGNSGRDMMVANGMGHGQRPQSGLAPVAKGPGSRHQQQQRSVFDDPVGILEQHAGGGPLAPLSIGLGPDGNFSQDHQGNMMGTNHAMGAGIGERILTNSGGRNMSNSSIADIHGGQPDAAGRMNYGGGAAPISSPHSGQIAAHFQQQQMQRLHLRAAGPGCGLPRTSGGNAMDLGQGRRRSNLGSAGGGGPWAGSEDPMPMALTSIPHSASSLPASAVPTVLERFPGFVRCVMDIAPEVVGWVIGRSGAHIKEMKHRSGCGMWVDQKDLKLYITGADMPRIHAAARLVGDLISKAPVNVNSAGVEDEVTSHMIECPPHLIGLLIGRGGSTIKRIKEESRANVVINQKMMKVIVSGIPQSVRLGVAMIEDVITFGRSAEHAGGIGHHPNFLEFPGSMVFGGLTGMSGMGSIGEYDDKLGDRFQLRPGPPPISGAGHLAPQTPFPGGPSSVDGSSGHPPAGGTYSGDPGPYDLSNMQQQRRPSSTQEMLTSQIAAGASVAVGGGGGGQPAEMGYHHDFSGCAGGKDMDWSVFSASSFNISPGDSGGQIHQQSQWEQTAMADHNSNPLSSQPSQTSSPSKHQQLQQAMSTQQESQLGNNMSSGSPSAGGGLHSAFAADNASGASMFGVGGSRGEGSGSGSISSGGTPPQRSISSTTVPSTIGGMMGGVSVGSKAVGSPSTSGTVAGTVAGAMARLSITPDDSTAAGQSLGQASRHRERAGSPVGHPANLMEFLGRMGLGEYALVLRENEIDLEAVQLMADSDFQDIGIPKGPRVKMLYALRTNRHPPKSGDINTMKSFLISLGLERYCKVFEEAEVDMCAVDVMEESDYAQLGVAKGPRLKMMNVLSKAGSGVARGNSGGGSATGSVSACSPEARHSPQFTHATSPFLSAPGGNGGALRTPITPPRRPSTAQISDENSPERSSDYSSRCHSPGLTSAVTGMGNGTMGNDAYGDITCGNPGTPLSRETRSDNDTGSVGDAEAFADRGVGLGNMFGRGLSTLPRGWATALGREGEGAGGFGISGKTGMRQNGVVGVVVGDGSGESSF